MGQVRLLKTIEMTGDAVEVIASPYIYYDAEAEVLLKTSGGSHACVNTLRTEALSCMWTRSTL